jgi:D-aminopeptidase
MRRLVISALALMALSLASHAATLAIGMPDGRRAAELIQADFAKIGVPIIAISGDDACVEETKALLGDVETVTKAFARLKDFKPLSLLPMIERVGAYGIRHVGKDITEISRLISFISRFSSDAH